MAPAASQRSCGARPTAGWLCRGAARRGAEMTGSREKNGLATIGMIGIHSGPLSGFSGLIPITHPMSPSHMDRAPRPFVPARQVRIPMPDLLRRTLGFDRVTPGCGLWRSLAVSGLIGVSLCCTGCPALNRWSGPNEDPFFSVPVDEGTSSRTTFHPVVDTGDDFRESEIADRPSAPAPRRGAGHMTPR